MYSNINSDSVICGAGFLPESGATASQPAIADSISFLRTIKQKIDSAYFYTGFDPLDQISAEVEGMIQSLLLKRFVPESKFPGSLILN